MRVPGSRGRGTKFASACFLMNLAEQVAEPPLPGFVQMEPVGRSQLSARAPAFMSFESFCRLLEQFPNIRQLQLQGVGEPFLHPRFFGMVSHAVARGIEVSTTSSLAGMSEPRAKECVASGLKRLHVTLDPADPSRTLRNLERLVREKHRVGASFPEIRLVAAVTGRNLEQLPDLVRLAHRSGAAALALHHEHQSLQNEDPARVEQWFGQARTLAAHLEVNLRLPDLQPRLYGKKRALKCDSPWRGAYLNLSGLALPCSMANTPQPVSFGNMAKDGVARVWTSAEYQAFREKLASSEPHEICRGCSVYAGTL